MSPHISRLLAQERHRDLLREADSSRLARQAARARSTSAAAPTHVARETGRASSTAPAGAAHLDRPPAGEPSTAMWPQPCGDALELPGRPLRGDASSAQPDTVGAEEREEMVVSGGLEPSTSRM